MVAVGLLISILAGFLLVRAIWAGPFRWQREDWLRLPLGAIVGIGLLSIPAFLTARPAYEADLGLLALAAILWALLGRMTAVVPVNIDERPVWKPAMWLALGIVAIMGSGYVLNATSNPHGDFDAWRIWNFRPRFLFRGESFAILTDPLLTWSHPEFPWLLSASVLRLWRWAGVDTQAGPMAIAGTFAVCLPMAVYGLIRIVRTHTQAWIGMAAVLASIGFMASAATEVADVPLASYLFGAFAAIVCAERLERPELAWLAGLCGGLAAWLKFEGAFYAVALAALAAWRLRGGGLLRFTLGALPGLAMTAFYWKTYAPATSTPGVNPLVLLFAILLRLLNFSFLGWVITPFLLFTVYAYCVKLSPRTGGWRAIWLPVALLFAAGCAAIWVRDDNPGDSAAVRLIVQLWPLAVTALFLHTNAPEDLIVHTAEGSPRKVRSRK